MKTGKSNPQKPSEPTRAQLQKAVASLASSERGTQALRDLLAFIQNGGDGLNLVNQAQVMTVLRCQFGPFAGSTREEIKAAVFAPGDASPAQERNTILAALRFYQQEGMGDPSNRSDEIHDIATNHDQEISLDADAIDRLCERLNRL